ncbi:MAG: TonB-dependent receptor [Pyrinomonadaceae bacterium]|nr:TonB-dependent receptor [Pyrinomonadaceae bacterium]
MLARKAPALLLSIAFLPPSLGALAQTPTMGRIAGTVQDERGAGIVGAQVTVISSGNGDERHVTTDREGYYAMPSLPPGIYTVIVKANGFPTAQIDNLTVTITDTTSVDAQLEVGTIQESVKINTSPLIQNTGPQLGRVVDSHTVSELPLATRNFTQILALSPGTAVSLADNTAVGRNSQHISVNGARVTQNSMQINGVDANNIGSNNAYWLAVPAPETIQEFKVQTSLYDATFGRSGGGNVQVITKSGTNDFHGAAYEYFRNNALNANNPFLKAAGGNRPELNRNVFGGLLGGSIRRGRTFFFISYQGTRERNGASPNSLSSSVLIASRLTDDRSEATLRNTFRPVLPNGQFASAINPIALSLLNVKLHDGRFLIPTPQVNGRYSGSAISGFREDQFNTNIDYRISERNWLAVKCFFSNAPSSIALVPNGGNVPGFGADIESNNRLISIQDVHSFSSKAVNEARFGYNFIREDVLPQEPVNDSEIGIRRVNADAFPGLGTIRIGRDAGAVTVGTSPNRADLQGTDPSVTAADVLSITWGKQTIRAGAEARYYQRNLTRNANTRGQIDFLNFNNFLIGLTSSSRFGSGIKSVSLRTTDYNFFLQDDWKVSSKLTLNLGVQYELDPPFYDTRGRISTFDPSLYTPRMLVGNDGLPVGPPTGGFVQAGNVIPQYDLPDVPNVGKRVVTSIDPDNFAPRIGFAYSALNSGLLVVRSGFGVFYSRASTFYIGDSIGVPPTNIVGTRDRPPLGDPYFAAPPQNSFPTFVPGVALSGGVFDRSLRTPYFYQYNASAQYAIAQDLSVEVAYVGTRGKSLLRQVAINQAPLASPQHPIINEVTGATITTNTPANAQLRAPFQGVEINAFSQKQSNAQSTYNSLQISLIKRLSNGFQLLASYTHGKSLDNASGGSASVGEVFDSSPILGNHLDNRVNRGVSDFDRTHRFVMSYLWDMPHPVLAARSTAGRLLFSNWRLAGIITAMSGLPVDIVDSGAGSFYGLNGANALTRPNWTPGATSFTASSNIPAGYFFNPFAFARPIVLAGQLIPSSNGTATASATGTDFGNVGRNVLRGPRQNNVDFSIIKRFPISESKNIEFRAEFFNLFNQVNFANPINNLNAVASSGGSIDPNTGRIIDPGDFGRIISTSNNPRLIQFALKLNY